MGHPYVYHSFFGGGVLMALFWVLIILLIIKLFSRSSWRHHRGFHMGPDMHTTALDLLKERYVKGEINKQEFEEKKKDIAG